MHVLRELLDGRPVDFHGDDLDLTLDPPRIRPANGYPPLYFGGLSDNAREVAAQAADVFLMWPDTLEGTGIGRARSGAGAAIVGDPDQVLAKLAAYRELGLEAFILSGYPHLTEADLFARHVLPRLEHAPLTRGAPTYATPAGSGSGE